MLASDDDATREHAATALGRAVKSDKKQIVKAIKASPDAKELLAVVAGKQLDQPPQPQQRSAVRAMIERERFAGRNCNGAFLGIKKDLHGAASSVMPVWVECALNRSCIAPEGSSRRNHRQDQAALTMLTKLRLPPSSGCQPLRSDGSMRFWRDQYYDVNSPVHFAELKRTATACTDDRQRRRAFEAGKGDHYITNKGKKKQ